MVPACLHVDSFCHVLLLFFVFIFPRPFLIHLFLCVHCHRQHAVTYYSQAGNMKRLAESYYALEDYANLTKLSESLPNNHQLLGVSPSWSKFMADIVTWTYN